ncbi:MAG: hypothetical protein ACOZNI_07795 [Myxococcota bacterium]
MTASRRAADLFIVAWIGLQLAVPASYYLLDRKWDERFAWRMYSAERMTRCGVGVKEYRGDGSRDVDLDGTYQRTWISLLSRGQPRVIDAVLVSRCTDPEVEQVRLRRRCKAPDGTQLEPMFYGHRCER